MTALLNVSEAHMESFGSFETLINTKEEIFSHTNTDQVVLNRDDEHFARWKKINKHKKFVKKYFIIILFTWKLTFLRSK